MFLTQVFTFIGNKLCSLLKDLLLLAINFVPYIRVEFYWQMIKAIKCAG